MATSATPENLILVVDSGQHLGQQAATFLGSEGYPVQTAGTVSEAVVRFNEAPAKVVLLGAISTQEACEFVQHVRGGNFGHVTLLGMADEGDAIVPAVLGLDVDEERITYEHVGPELFNVLDHLE